MTNQLINLITINARCIYLNDLPVGALHLNVDI